MDLILKAEFHWEFSHTPIFTLTLHTHLFSEMSMNVLMGQYVHSNLVSLENILNLCSAKKFKKLKNFQMIKDTLYRIREALKKP